MSLYDITVTREPSLKDKALSAAGGFFKNLFSPLTAAPVGVARATTTNYANTHFVENADAANAIANQAVNNAEATTLAGSEVMALPYREFVARPLSTAMLASNREYQMAVTGKQSTSGTPVPLYDVALSAINNPEAWRKAWLDARHVSPGQATVGYVGSKIDGTQSVDNVDWTNKDSVDAYFGSYSTWAKYASGGIDLGLNIVGDPYVLAGSGTGAAVRKFINNACAANPSPEIHPVQPKPSKSLDPFRASSPEIDDQQPFSTTPDDQNNPCISAPLPHPFYHAHSCKTAFHHPQIS